MVPECCGELHIKASSSAVPKNDLAFANVLDLPSLAPLWGGRTSEHCTFCPPGAIAPSGWKKNSTDAPLPGRIG